MRRSSLTRATRTKPEAASRVSNGRVMLAGVDGRSMRARRYRDLCRAIFIDQGGEDRLSETRKQLIRRFASLGVQAEELEARLVRGETVDLGAQSVIASTMVRIASRIGINRMPKNITPGLRDYLDIKAAEFEPEPRTRTGGRRMKSIPRSRSRSTACCSTATCWVRRSTAMPRAGRPGLPFSRPPSRAS